MFCSVRLGNETLKDNSDLAPIIPQGIVIQSVNYCAFNALLMHYFFAFRSFLHLPLRNLHHKTFVLQLLR